MKRKDKIELPPIAIKFEKEVEYAEIWNAILMYIMDNDPDRYCKQFLHGQIT